MSTNPRTAAPPSVLPDHVADYVRNAIFSGLLSPGQRLDPETLSQQLGVSRQPVREALITLWSEGLVERRPRRVTVVATLTSDDILDHYQSFGLLSGIAAQRAAVCLKDADFRSLRASIVQLKSATQPAEQGDMNFAFHRIINQAGASRRLASLLRLLNKSIPSHFFEMTPNWVQTAVRDHRAILAALMERDGQRASDLMSEHLQRAGYHAVQTLEKAGFWSKAGEL